MPQLTEIEAQVLEDTFQKSLKKKEGQNYVYG